MSGSTPAGSSRAVGADGDRDDPRSSRRVVDPETSVFRRGTRTDQADDDHDDRRSNAFVTTLKFVYRHSTALVPASFLWVLCSLPLVTVGPASLGVYAVVLSLRETGRVDRERVVETVRTNLVPATLLGFLPVTFVAIASLYVLTGLASGLVGTALTAVALYAGLYVGVLLIPTFVSMAGGVEPRTALRESYVWLAGSPVTGLQLLLVTAALLVATVGLSVGFLLLFAGVTATYHVEVIVRTTAEEVEALPSFATR
ncbi:hypothetical protein [Salinigranum halophilum]|jgi:hypothetical protein|uniref:hypothetical protein n=1 Tax=Salinigranum halophilum TaxID=2565931 RepID=UPI00115E8E2F|nr:hypothetical protein [Salinigranum halophilum]